jgi:hypothetical protein
VVSFLLAFHMWHLTSYVPITAVVLNGKHFTHDSTDKHNKTFQTVFCAALYYYFHLVKWFIYRLHVSAFTEPSSGVFIYENMSHCIRCGALLGYTTKNLFVIVVKILIYIIKVFLYYQIPHLLYYINCKTIKTIKIIKLFYNYFATIEHLSYFCWSVSLFLSMVTITYCYTRSITLDRFFVMDSSVV